MNLRHTLLVRPGIHHCIIVWCYIGTHSTLFYERIYGQKVKLKKKKHDMSFAHMHFYKYRRFYKLNYKPHIGKRVSFTINKKNENIISTIVRIVKFPVSFYSNYIHRTGVLCVYYCVTSKSHCIIIIIAKLAFLFESMCMKIQLNVNRNMETVAPG